MKAFCGSCGQECEKEKNSTRPSYTCLKCQKIKNSIYSKKRYWDKIKNKA